MCRRRERLHQREQLHQNKKSLIAFMMRLFLFAADRFALYGRRLNIQGERFEFRAVKRLDATALERYRVGILQT